MADGSVVTAREVEKRTHPERKVALQKYALRRIFKYRHAGPIDKPKHQHRTPNPHKKISDNLLAAIIRIVRFPPGVRHIGL